MNHKIYGFDSNPRATACQVDGQLFTYQDLDNFLVTAFEGGIDYWARVFVQRDKPRWEWLVSELDHRETPGACTALSLAAVVIGLERMTRRYPEQYRLLLDGNYDASTADILLQLALFDEVRYG